ncbi:MAG: putative unusual protein kinase regulating ubiquinone biosynthesis (AarF/ABC1/UbiB family) [Zhongshania sp.]|jgi:predicted unusual protein kinase regulating ubiquinone biosynthesis (AarF/ABC1/UbiB family)
MSLHFLIFLDFMSDKDSKTIKPLHALNTGAISRRFELSKMGLRYGSRALRQRIWERFTGDSDAALAKRRENVDFLVEELGRLKGSVVKIGQIMATYGDYILPPEVAAALHSLEDNTTAMSWAVIQKTLKHELGEERLAALDIDPQPLAAASLGQVHRATLRSSGEALCIKVQYPGVEDTIDADFNAVMRLLKISRLIASTRNLDDWFGDIRLLLHKEVDYEQERRDLGFVAAALADDARFVVPKCYPEFCTRRILTMSYETAESVNSALVADLPQARRDKLGRAVLDVFLAELFDWRRMQTDPNFGNFRVRIDEHGAEDTLVLLDFGAMRMLPSDFADEFCAMLMAAYQRDRPEFLAKSLSLGFMKANFPVEVLDNFVDIGIDIAEPLRLPDANVPACAINSTGQYHWRNSGLPKRIAKRAMGASMSRYFALPPKEFLYVMRKLMGVYALIAVLDAQFTGNDAVDKYHL